MKLLVVLVAVFAVSCARKIDLNAFVNKIQAVSKKDDSSSEEIKDILKDGLKEITSQVEIAVCKSNGTKVYEATLKAVECAEKTKSDGLICDSITGNFKKCIEPVEKVFEECLEAKFHEVPKLIIDSVVSTTEYLCNSKVKDIVELTNPCAAVDPDELKACVGTIESKLKDINNVKNLKLELCGELTKQKTCILGAVDKKCKHEVTKKSFADLYEAAIVKPCSA